MQKRMTYRFDTSSPPTTCPLNKADVVKRDASLYAFSITLICSSSSIYALTFVIISSNEISLKFLDKELISLQLAIYSFYLFCALHIGTFYNEKQERNLLIIFMVKTHYMPDLILKVNFAIL